MYIEAFTAAKSPAEPWRNEDALLLHAGSLFAVIDGVTDKVGVRYGERTSGQWAGRAIAAALRDLVDDDSYLTAPAQEILGRINEEIRRHYRRLGIELAAAADPNRRFAAQLAAVFTDGCRLRLLVVGDCGIRLDGDTVLTESHPADGIMAQVRALVFRELERQGVPHDRNLEVARAYTVEGIGRFRAADAGALDHDTFTGLQARVRNELPARFPGLEAGLVRRVAERGLRGMAAGRNSTGPLGHGCIDGFELPDEHVLEHWTSFDELDTLELFSDGYFGIPEAHGRVAHWEARIARIERQDPAKVDTVLSTKGSLPGQFTDDRTVLILRKEVPPDAAG